LARPVGGDKQGERHGRAAIAAFQKNHRSQKPGAQCHWMKRRFRFWRSLEGCWCGGHSDSKALNHILAHVWKKGDIPARIDSCKFFQLGPEVKEGDISDDEGPGELVGKKSKQDDLEMSAQRSPFEKRRKMAKKKKLLGISTLAPSCAKCGRERTRGVLVVDEV